MEGKYPRRPQRDARHLEEYRGESRRMREETPPAEEAPAAPLLSAPPSQNRDEMVILPLLLLLLHEGADRYLVLALLYILM